MVAAWKSSPYIDPPVKSAQGRLPVNMDCRMFRLTRAEFIGVILPWTAAVFRNPLPVGKAFL